MEDVTGGRRGLRRMWSLRIALLAIVAGTGVLTAACGGGSGTPHVASLTHNSRGGGPSGTGAGTAPAAPAGSPTKLLDEWAACMRRHGDPGQTDPTVDASKVIHIDISPSIPGGDSGTTGQNGTGGPGTYCISYLTEAANELTGNSASVKPLDQAALDKFSACVRANGVPNFPDLRAPGNVMHLNGDVNLNNPVMLKAEKLCGQKTGVYGLPGEGAPPPGTIIDDGAGGGPGAGG
jgi:hypothetical protein